GAGIEQVGHRAGQATVFQRLQPQAPAPPCRRDCWPPTAMAKVLEVAPRLPKGGASHVAVLALKVGNRNEGWSRKARNLTARPRRPGKCSRNPVGRRQRKPLSARAMTPAHRAPGRVEAGEASAWRQGLTGRMASRAELSLRRIRGPGPERGLNQATL